MRYYLQFFIQSLSFLFLFFLFFEAKNAKAEELREFSFTVKLDRKRVKVI